MPRTVEYAERGFKHLTLDIIGQIVGDFGHFLLLHIVGHCHGLVRQVARGSDDVVVTVGTFPGLKH